MMRGVCKSILFTLLLVLLCFPVISQEVITLTTYYPAPYGVYKEMIVHGRTAIGDADGDGNINNDDLALDSSGDPLLGSLTIGGSLGLGTAKPVSKMHITGDQISSFTGTNEGILRIDGEYNVGYYEAIDFSYDDISPNPTARIAAYHDGSGSRLVFGTSSSYANGITNTAMTINSQGNIGIGTTSPQGKLHVKEGGASDSRPRFVMEDSTGKKYDIRLRTKTDRSMIINHYFPLAASEPRWGLFMQVDESQIVYMKGRFVIPVRSSNPPSPKEGEIWLID